MAFAFERLLADRRLRYALAGTVTSLLYWGLFALAWRLFGDNVSYVVLTAVAQLTTALIMYPHYRTRVFGSELAWLKGFPRFYAVWIGGLAVSVLGMPLLIEVAHVPVLVAQAVTIAAVPLAAYFAHRLWTFA